MCQIFDKGGIIVWILAAYAFIALTIVFERMIRFTYIVDKPKKNFETLLLNAFRLGKPDNVIASIRGPEARVLQGVLSASNEGIQDLNRVAIHLGSLELINMEKGFRTLSFLGNTAPLLQDKQRDNAGIFEPAEDKDLWDGLVKLTYSDDKNFHEIQQTIR